ncbi:MAG: hypothetical protein MUD00_01240 [Candidatus Pacebacteria bacterium]|jgi:hypothetical protein|nr:hypothetical protein [Candidatus Paceibacterota bacterium]
MFKIIIAAFRKETIFFFGSIGAVSLVVVTLYTSEAFGLFYGQLFVVVMHSLVLAWFFLLQRNTTQQPIGDATNVLENVI